MERDSVERVELIMRRLGLSANDRRVVAPAQEAARQAQTRGKGSDGFFCGGHRAEGWTNCNRQEFAYGASDFRALLQGCPVSAPCLPLAGMESGRTKHLLRGSNDVVTM